MKANPHTHSNKPLRNMYWALFMILGIQACDLPHITPPDRPAEREYATRILDIVYTPNPLVSGDSATFKAVIKDSLETGFLYHWMMVNQTVNDSSNTIRVLVNLEPGEYNHSLVILKTQKKTATKTL